MTAAYPDVLYGAGVLYTHKDPASRTARKFAYVWEDLRSRRTGTSHVWVFRGDVGRLMTRMNALDPKRWRFSLAGVSRNPPGRRRRNPEPRDPMFVGAFNLGHEPKKSGDFVDGDVAVVESPHRTRLPLDRPYEIWVFGMIDPHLGDTWNYVSGPMSRSDAVAEAKRLLR